MKIVLTPSQYFELKRIMKVLEIAEDDQVVSIYCGIDTGLDSIASIGWQQGQTLHIYIPDKGGAKDGEDSVHQPGPG